MMGPTTAANLLEDLGGQIKLFKRYNVRAFTVQRDAFCWGRADVRLELPCGHQSKVTRALIVILDDEAQTCTGTVKCPECGEKAAERTLWPPL